MHGRRTRRGIIVGGFAAALGGTALRSAVAATFEERRVLSWKPALYHGWPTIARRSDGELLLVFSGGRESHVCPFGRVELMRSQNDGAAWRWPQVLYDGPIDDRDAGVVETPKGSILVTTFTSLAYADRFEKARRIPPGEPGGWDEAKLREWTAVHDRVNDEQRRTELGCWMLRSTDGGVTWSARYRVPVNSPHGPIALRDGRLLYPGIALWDADRKVGVCESIDDGQSWHWLGDIPVRSGDTSASYHELHAVEASNGRIICHVRNHNPANANEILQSESADGGRTWSQPHPIGVWGLPSHLLRLRDGRLLMTYGYRRKPFGNQARLSEDNGTTWGEPITLSDDGVTSDLGYPSTAECGDGLLVTVWYETLPDSPMAQLRQVRWRLS